MLSSLLFSSCVLLGGLQSAQGATSSCSETITVTDMYFGGGYPFPCENLGFPCETLKGVYYYNGLNDEAYPVYTQPSTGAFFTVRVETYSTEENFYASTYFEYSDMNGTYFFYPGWDHFSDVTVQDGGSCPLDRVFVEYGALGKQTI